MRIALGALALVVVTSLAPGTALGADRKPPKVASAAMLDKDQDGFADRLVLTYTEKIRHRTDDDGTYPLRVVGYKIERIGWASGRTLSLKLIEKTKTDPAARPDLLYDRGRDEGVYDRAGNEARTQTFKDTKAFVSVPDGSALLIVNVLGPGNVSTLDGSFDCATSCYEIVEETPLLMLMAQAADGATFAGWDGACADFGTQGACTLGTG